MSNCCIKKNADGEALAKLHKSMEGVSIPRVLNVRSVVPEDYVFPNGKPVVSKGMGNRESKKKVNTLSKSSLKEHVKIYDVISELANAPSGLKFAQLVRGDADLAKKTINRLFPKRATRKQALAGNAEIRARRLCLINISVYGPERQNALGTGAVPNIIYPQLMQRLSLTSKGTYKHITVSNGKNYRVFGSTASSSSIFGRTGVHDGVSSST